MSERSDQPTQPANPELRCGDCRRVVAPGAVSPDALAPAYSSVQASPTPSGHQTADYYCPVCAKPTLRPMECPQCGSLICPECGTPLESADDLGIG